MLSPHLVGCRFVVVLIYNEKIDVRQLYIMYPCVCSAYFDKIFLLKIAVRSQLPQDVPEPERMLFFVRSTNPVQSSVKRVKKSHVTLPRGFIPPHLHLRYPRMSSAVIHAYPCASQRAPEYRQTLTFSVLALPSPSQF
jgi:hypothetical protein